MATGNDIVQALESGAISANEREVKFVSFQCRTCDAHGPWINANDRENPAGAFDAHHADQTGHTKFYMWSMQRNTAEVFTLPMRRKTR